MANNNNSLICTGTTQSFNIGTITGIDFGFTTDIYTFFFWLKTSTTVSSNILDKTGTAPTTWPVFARLNTAGKVNMQTFDGTTNPNVSSTGVINDGSWHHVALQRDRNGAQKLSIFIDKAANGTTSDTLGAISNSSSYKVMGASRQGESDLNGRIDELTIYNALITPTNANWQADHTGETNLQGYYQFDNNPNDSSPNANHGTTSCSYSGDVPFAIYNIGGAIMRDNTKFWG